MIGHLPNRPPITPCGPDLGYLIEVVKGTPHGSHRSQALLLQDRDRHQGLRDPHHLLPQVRQVYHC